MAQVNITLNDEEVLQVLAGNREDALKFLLEKIVNEIMKAESEEQLGASKHERTEDRTDYRNGFRERELTTRIGTITLQVPRHRNEPFHTMIFEQYKRSEASLIATMVQMVIAGVSTRKVEKVVETLCGTGFSKSTVSRLCQVLDKEIETFRNRPLDYVYAPFLMVDATYFKAREDHRIKSKAFLTVLGIKSDGTREVLDFAVYDNEDNYSWRAFFERLKQRGLKDPKLVISDAHKSIRKAIAEVYPEAAWQRCQVHLRRNIMDVTPNKYKEGLKIELNRLFNAKTRTEAEQILREITADYEDVASKAMETLVDGFDDAMTVMCLPEYIRIVLRSTNLIERLNRELKRRSDVIQVFPNMESILRLMGSIAIEYSDSQAGVQRLFTEVKYESMSEEINRSFREIAAEQVKLLKAA